MFVMSVALNGCLKAPPVEFGLTEDTGGHITYVLGAAIALALRPDVSEVEIVTRLIDDAAIGPAYSQPLETISPRLTIRRLDTGNRRYLSKEAGVADRPAFLETLCSHIAALVRKPDVIHAHFADAGAIALEVRKRFGIPFVYTAHSLGIDKSRSGSACPDLAERTTEEDRIIGAADAIVASSRDEAERQLMLYPSACPARIHCIPPGASLEGPKEEDTRRARALIEPFLRNPDKPIVLAIARPVLKKNLAGLIDLFANDAALRARVNLVILAGLRDGPSTGETEQREVISGLLERMDRHDLYGSLALPKRHDQADVRALYGLARESGGVFVNPAFTEPYGLTLAEAASHGLPVVATSHGGARDIVRSFEHGLVADPNDPVAFATAIRTLLNDKAAWTSASDAGRRNSAHQNWDGYARRFIKAIKPLVSAGLLEAIGPQPRRLLLCDIDNTLTGCRPGARELTRYLGSDRELAFGVATGRSLQEAARLLEEWQVPAPRVVITSVGAEIYWRESDRLVADVAYRSHIDRGWEPQAVRDRLIAISGIEPQPAVEQRRHKLSYFVSEPSVVAAVRDTLSDLPVRVIHSHTRFLDVVPDRAGKGAAMVWVARQLGIPRDQVFAAGDSGNDLDMLAACRNPILVANHSDELAPLIGMPTVYVAHRPYAGGVVEGMRAHSRRAAA